MSGAELLPTRATYRPGEVIGVEVRGVDGPGELTVLHLGDLVSRTVGVGAGTTSVGMLAPGGYGVEWRRDGVLLRTALDVRAPGTRRVRYGFTATYRPGRAVDGLLEGMRRLHQTDLQCYDWAYRHADLLGGGEQYLDALGQPISLDTVRRIASGAASIGAHALGYAAVYGVGNDEWHEWSEAALLDGTGSPYALGDFLRVVDPAFGPWTEHFVDELRAALQSTGLHGFHLDQYGWPKVARRADGVVVDLRASFTRIVEAAREAVPDARLVFNNVNDFPTSSTAAAPLDAVYIEVWEPNTTYDDLAALVDRARALGAGKPVVVAAYQHVYASAPAALADAAASLTMATLHSHGAAHLLAGEEDRVLVDPYYVRNHVVVPSTAALLQRNADFLVEHDEVLLDPGLEDVTAAMAGAYNDDCDVTIDGVDISGSARAGTVWRRIRRLGDRLVVHLIDLTEQTDTAWDGPKRPSSGVAGGVLRVRRIQGFDPQVRAASVDGRGPLEELRVEDRGTHIVVALPPIRTWQVVVVDLIPS